LPQELAWRDGKGFARRFFQDVQDLLWLHAGPIRNGESLREGLDKAAAMETQLAEHKAEKFSMERDALAGCLLVSKAIMRASLEREESRGAHYHEDFTRGDDTVWFKNIDLHLDRERRDLLVPYSDVPMQQR